MPEDKAVPATPPTKVDGGTVYLPAHALRLAAERIACHGLLFARVDGEQWSAIESLWMTDQELDLWRGVERVFAVMPYAEDASTESSTIFGRAFAAYGAIVEAARLVAPGTWIDTVHLVPVAAGNNGFNVRLTGPERPRLWAAVFGDPLKVHGRRRAWRNRVECRPLQYHLPHGPAFLLDESRARIIETVIGNLDNLRKLAPDHGWWFANRAYQRAHDLFLPRRHRLTALFGVLEAIYGPFRREPCDAGLGVAVVAALERAGRDTSNLSAYVERELRQARNRLAHGSDLAVSIDFASVEANLLEIVRTGLNQSLDWICGCKDSEAPRTLGAFQLTIGRVVAEED